VIIDAAIGTNLLRVGWVKRFSATQHPDAGSIVLHSPHVAHSSSGGLPPDAGCGSQTLRATKAKKYEYGQFPAAREVGSLKRLTQSTSLTQPASY
jgi:hypothetical protein